jgi:hypothetical protein
MAESENRRETGARKYPARSGSDPSDEFSQKAAGNKRPKDGMGLTRRRAGSTLETPPNASKSGQR